MYSSYSIAAATCSVIFAVLATMAVALRFYARRIQSLAYGADDYIVLLALVELTLDLKIVSSTERSRSVLP